MATLQFLKSNELDNTYAHSIDFESLESQNAFWQTQIINQWEIGLSTSRLLANGLTIDVGIPFAQLININYLRIYQDGKHWYFFINDKQYINENNTHLVVEMDIFQTFMFDYELGESLVEREHQPRYNPQGYPIFSLTQENIDVGDTLEKKRVNKIYDNVPEGFNPDGKYGDLQLFWLKVMAREDLLKNNVSPTTVKGLPTNIYYYVVPIMFKPAISLGQSNVYINNVLNFDNAYLGITKEHLKLLVELPEIISVSVSRYCPFDYDGLIRANNSGGNDYLFVPKLNLAEYNIDNVIIGDNSFNIIRIVDLQTIDKTLTGIDFNLRIDINDLNITRQKRIIYEPKLWHKDYTKLVLEMGTQKQVLDVMLQGFNTYKYINAYSVRDSAILAPNFYASLIDTDASYEFGIKTDSTTLEIPLRTDAWLQYLSENKNSLITGIVGQTINAGIGLAGSFASPIGVLGGIQQGTNLVTNIAGTIGKIKDIQNTPDTVSVPNNDYVMAYLEEDLFYKEKLFTIPSVMRERVFNYLYAYGYKAGEFKTPNLKSRYYFNFIKIIGASIKSELDNSYVNKLVEIYQNGITIWHYRNAETWKGTLNYEYENVEIQYVEV